jgi:ribonuclease PH
MTESKTKSEKEKKKITVNIRGEVLMQAIELRQKREREAGTVVSVTEVIGDAIREKYEREIGKAAVEQ